jgi:hypothetical protein
VSEPAVPTAKNPWKSPSYPQRVHVRERSQWKAVLAQYQDRVAQAGRELQSGPAPSATRQRAYAQLQGALDQIAEAVRRMPGETGDLYHDDHHRLEQATAAADRLLKAWPTTA